MSKKYLFFSALGHSLLFASIAFPAHASRGLASEATCQELIDADLAPFREQVRAIWVTDNLFMYAEVARIFSHELLDKDPGLRAKIEDFKQGKASPTASELQSLLNAKADQTSGFADSLSRRYASQFNNHWFKWHYPVIRVGDHGSSRVTFSLPVDVGDYALQMDLGADTSKEDQQLTESAVRIIALRSGVLLPHSGAFSPEFKSEKDYLTRPDQKIRRSCLADLYPRYAALDLSLPAHKEQAAVDEATSRGYWENHWIMGYPTSNIQGSGLHPAPVGGGGNGIGETHPAPLAEPIVNTAIVSPSAVTAEPAAPVTQ